MKGNSKKALILLILTVMLMTVETVSALAAGSHSFNNDSWEGELTNLNWNQISVDFWGPKLDWDHPYKKWWFIKIPSIKLGASIKVGSEGDFKVKIKEPNLNSSVTRKTHITSNAKDIWLGGKGMYKERFSPSNILDWLKVPAIGGSVSCDFVAASNQAVEAEGHFKNITTASLSVEDGASHKTECTFDFTSVKPTEANQSMETLVFFIGSELNESIDFLRVKIPKILDWGPLVSIQIDCMAGANTTAILEKNKENINSQFPNKNEIHACVIEGDPGCVSGIEDDIADDTIELAIKIGGDTILGNMTIYSNHWNLSDSYRMVLGNKEFVQSLTFGDGLKYQPKCEHIYYKVPVEVWKNTEKTDPAKDSNVYVTQKFLHSDVLAHRTTGSESNKTHIYLPAQTLSVYGQAMIGDVYYSGSAEASATDIRKNETVYIILGTESDNKQYIKAQKVWDIDLEDLDRPDRVKVAIERRRADSQEWDIYEYADPNDNNKTKLAVHDLMPSENETDNWTWKLEVPKFVRDDNDSTWYVYRVRELKEGASYSDDTYNAANSEGKAAIREKLKSDIIYEYSDDEYNGNIVDFSVDAYTTLAGELVAPHKTKYAVTYNWELYADTDDTPLDTDDELWTITNTAIYDATISKRFIASEKEPLPSEVFLTLTSKPKSGWASIANMKGVSFWELPVLYPLAGGMTLQKLDDAGLFDELNVPGLEDLLLAVGRANAANDYSVDFTVKKYQNGIPLDFGCTELNTDLVQEMFLQVFDLVVPVEVHSENNFVMIPGGAYPLLDDETKLVGTVLNVLSEYDSKHTIGGTKYWVNTNQTELKNIGSIKIHVFENDTELDNIVVSAENNTIKKEHGSEEILTSWVWCVTSKDIDTSDNNKTYTITEEFLDSYTNQGNWYSQINGYDLINTWTGSGEKHIRFYKLFDSFFKPSVYATSWKENKIKVQLQDKNNENVQEYEWTIRDNETRFQCEYTLSEQSWKELQNCYLKETSLTASLKTGYSFIPVSSDPVLSIDSGTAYLNYAVTNRLQMDYTLHAKKVWDPNSGDTNEIKFAVLKEDPDSVETLVEENCTLTNSNWDADLTDLTNTYKRLNSNGKPYIYILKEDPIVGYESSWTSKANYSESKLTFILTNKKISDAEYVNLTVTKEWDDNDNAAGLRPKAEEVKFSVIGQDGLGEYHSMASKGLETATEGSVSFSALPRYDATGAEYTYFVLEGYAPGYATSYSQDEETPTSWKVTNKLIGDCEITVKKIVTNAPENSEQKVFKFQINYYNGDIELFKHDSYPMPPEPSKIEITDAGSLILHFPIDKEGIYVYTLQEAKGEDNTSIDYDTTPRTIVINAEREDGGFTYSTWVKLNNLEAENYEDLCIQTDTVTFNNIYSNTKDITVTKKWDIDLEEKDKPDYIYVALESQSYNSIYDNWSNDNEKLEWKLEELDGNVWIQKLSSENNWTYTFEKLKAQDVDAEGNKHEIKYRVRELKETTEEEIQRLAKENVLERIVHAKEDTDQITYGMLRGAGNYSVDDAYQFELNDGNRDLFSKDALYDAPTVEYKVPEYQTIKGEIEKEHWTRYNVKYEKKDNGNVSITNTAVLDTNIYKRWIGFEDSDKPDSVYLTLMGRVREDYREMVPPQMRNLAETYIPVINPLTNGMTLSDIVGLRLPESLDGGITSMSLAIAKATDDKDDPLKAWHVDFEIKKYGMFGVPMEYQGAELSSAILQSLIKAVTGLNIPISFSITGGYVSTPGKAYCIPILDKDWELTANVFNIKIDIPTPSPSSVPTPTPDPSDPPVPPVPIITLVPIPTPIPPTPNPSGDPGGDPTPTPRPSGDPTPTPKPSSDPTPTPTKTPEWRVLTGVKYWINDKEEDRPEWIKIHVYKGSQEIVGSPITVKAPYTGSNAWPWALVTTDKSSDDSFTIAEEFPPQYDYLSKYYSELQGFNLYNYGLNGKTPEVRIRKIWSGEQPAGATVKVGLYAKDGSRIGIATLKEGNQYVDLVSPQPPLSSEYIGQFEIKEIEMDGVDSDKFVPVYSGPTISYNAEKIPVYTFTVKNQPKTNMHIVVKKVWDDNNNATRPEKVGVTIIRTASNGDKLEIPFDLNSAEHLVLGTSTWERETTIDEEEKFPAVDEEGNAYTYSIKEDSISNYQPSMKFRRDGNTITFTLTNTLIPEDERVTVEGVKVWKDKDNQYGLRPSKIRIVVMNNHYEQVQDLTLDADAANWSIPDLPMYDSSGEQLKYFVIEEGGDVYTVSYPTPTYNKETKTWQCDVWNTYTACKKVTVEKKWEGDTEHPRSLAVFLYAGDHMRASVYLNQNNNWTYTFEDLPILNGDDGSAIAYRVEEEIPEGYSLKSYSEYDGLDEHFYLMNTSVSEGTLVLPVEKIITGGLPSSGEAEKFEFKIEPLIGFDAEGNYIAADKVPMPQNDTVEIQNKGTASYLIPFNKACVCYYAISETPGSNENYTYDTVTRLVMVDARKDSSTNKFIFNWWWDEVIEDVEDVYPEENTSIKFINQLKIRPYTIIYDPNGGMFADGQTTRKYFTHYYGELIVIHDAPTWKWHKFLYWAGSEYQPGDFYLVTGDHTFVAQWSTEYEYRFKFTKVWDGKAGSSLSYKVYDMDGKEQNIKFNAPEVNGNTWTYEKWFDKVPQLYVVEEVPQGYFASYQNVGTHADETDRVYNNGTIINHKVPETGDKENWVLWLGLGLGSIGLICVIWIVSRRRKTEVR